MAVLACNELASLRGAGNQNGIRTYTRVFRVITDSPADGPLAVTRPAAIPRLWTFYDIGTEYDRGATVRSVEPQQDQENPFQWDVVVQYSNEPLPRRWPTDPTRKAPKDGSGGDRSEVDPTLFLPTFKFGTIFRQKPARKDYQGKAIRNSAGDEFEPHIEFEEAWYSLVISRNEASFNPVNELNYFPRTNSVDWKFWGILYGAGTALYRGPSVVQQFDRGVSYVKVDREFWIRPDDWQEHVLDAGFYYYSGSPYPGGSRTRFFDKENRPSSVALPLDGTGQALTIGGNPDAVYLNFTVFKSANFYDILNVPDPLA